MNKRGILKGHYRGQATLEYFIIFAAIAAVMLISSMKLWPRIRDRLQGTGANGEGGFYYEAGSRLVGADGGGAGTYTDTESQVTEIIVPPTGSTDPYNWGGGA